MKTEWSFGFTRTLLLSLGLVAAGLASAADQVVYCARVNSGSTTIWDPPFWWIYAGGSAYSTATVKSTADGTPAGRLGSYVHTANSLFPGDGFGLVCAACSAEPNSVYQVDVTQPSSNVATDTIFGVCSTNCAIGGLSGGAGSPTNTTAFQAANSVNKWGFVCWLTNTAGVPYPEIEFHYVSGGTASLRHFADCVRFTRVTPSGVPTPVHISSFAGSALQYTGGSGTRFVLLKCASLWDWQRVATNFVTPGLFTIPAVGTEAAVFYAIASE
jgi:hypothetical protein